MKLPFLILLSVVGFTASAQINNEEVIKNKLEELKKKLADNQSNANAFRFGPDMRANILGAKPLTVPVKPGTYNLPQDGMPCIVPDTEGIAAMPNAAKVVKVPFRSQMPNAYKPKTDIPDVTK